VSERIGVVNFPGWVGGFVGFLVVLLIVLAVLWFLGVHVHVTSS